MQSSRTRTRIKQETMSFYYDCNYDCDCYVCCTDSYYPSSFQLEEEERQMDDEEFYEPKELDPKAYRTKQFKKKSLKKRK